MVKIQKPPQSLQIQTAKQPMAPDGSAPVHLDHTFSPKLLDNGSMCCSLCCAAPDSFLKLAVLLPIPQGTAGMRPKASGKSDPHFAWTSERSDHGAAATWPPWRSACRCQAARTDCRSLSAWSRCKTVAVPVMKARASRDTTGKISSELQPRAISRRGELPPPPEALCRSGGRLTLAGIKAAKENSEGKELNGSENH